MVSKDVKRQEDKNEAGVKGDGKREESKEDIHLYSLQVYSKLSSFPPHPHSLLRHPAP